MNGTQSIARTAVRVNPDRSTGLARTGWASLAVLALALAAPHAALAACGRLTLQDTGTVDWQGATGSDYEVFDPTDRVQAVTITVQKSQGGTCNYAIGFSEGSSGSFNPRQIQLQSTVLAYNLYDTAAHSTILRDAPAGGPFIHGSFTNAAAATETHSHTYYWLIPAGQIVPGSNTRYSDRPDVYVYEDVNGTLTQRDTAKKRHRARVPKVVELSLVDSGAAFSASDIAQTLDFGIFFTGQQLSFDLRARGNTAFTVTLQSLNQGTMKHTTLNSRVPYTLTVSGTTVNLTSGNAVTVASFTGATTSVQGIAYPTRVTVGSLVGTLGGLHKDSITASLIAQ